MKITDALGAQIRYVPIILVSNQESAPLEIVVTPDHADEALTASIDANAGAWARETGTAGAWIDLDAAPIPLAPYMGGSVHFDVKVIAGAIAGRAQANLFVGVFGGSAAGWMV
jgi:hypothetical protein